MFGKKYNIGEKPGNGVYLCTSCNTRVHLDDSSDRLPPCNSKRCKGKKIQYVKIG